MYIHMYVLTDVCSMFLQIYMCICMFLQMNVCSLYVCMFLQMYVCLEQGEPGQRGTMWETIQQSTLGLRKRGVRVVGVVKEKAIPLRTGDDVMGGWRER